jgi:Tol biopolymer transport system component
LSVTSFGAANPYNGLHVINLGTGRDTLLLPCCGDWFDIDWSPDGTRLAYVTTDQFYRQGEIYIVGARRRASGEAKPRRLGWGDRPSWSPDGQWIAFSRAVDGRRSVYVARPSGEDEHLLVARGSAPAWAPDGRTIAYRTGCHILLVTPSGAKVTPKRLRGCVRSGGSVLRDVGPPVWSPDGKKLAFSAPGRDLLFGPVTHGTFVMDADGTNMRRVSASALGTRVGQQARPAWQPVR